MTPSSIELVGAGCLALALVHSFSVNVFHAMAVRFEEGSVAENVFHLLGEIEIVFGLWSLPFLLWIALSLGPPAAVEFLESRTFTEPIFVFVVLCICSTRPLLALAASTIEKIAKTLPLPGPLAFYATCLIVGPLLGSIITEPAAMTVTALLLAQRLFSQNVSDRLKYGTLAVLFVNVSIGGVLTPYAAPPILMVARPWGWNLTFMLQNFGWKAAVAVLIITLLTTFLFRQELSALEVSEQKRTPPPPRWIRALHLMLLTAVILTAHHVVIFAGVFLFFLGLYSVTREYQDELRLREGLLVSFFLAGLVVLGTPQRWWLEPILSHLKNFPLFASATALTAITDNAALTYLGAQVPQLTESSRYALVAGAVTGGGLTVIANAPNPVGYGILNPFFGETGIQPLRLFRAALLPTLVAALCFWLF